jgi:signal transduction histidine kinase
LHSSDATAPSPRRLRCGQADGRGVGHPIQGCWLLDYSRPITHYFRRDHDSGRPIALETGDVHSLRETVDRLDHEVAELRVSRKLLVLAADADSRRIERQLHSGTQQHLIALAMRLQLVEPLVDADPAAAKVMLEEMKRDVEEALAETTQLAQRIYPPLLTSGDLAAAMRAAAANAGLAASVDVAPSARFSPEEARTVYLCWLGALEHAAGEAEATVAGGDEEVLAFEFIADGTHPDTEFEGLTERVDALGGSLTIRSGPGVELRLSGSLPVSG